MCLSASVPINRPAGGLIYHRSSGTVCRRNHIGMSVMAVVIVMAAVVVLGVRTMVVVTINLTIVVTVVPGVG